MTAVTHSSRPEPPTARRVGESESLCVRFTRYAPCALSERFGFPHTLFLQALVPFNLLPMFPNDCYPCSRSKEKQAGPPATKDKNQ